MQAKYGVVPVKSARCKQESRMENQSAESEKAFTVGVGENTIAVGQKMTVQVKKAIVVSRRASRARARARARGASKQCEQNCEKVNAGGIQRSSSTEDTVKIRVSQLE